MNHARRRDVVREQLDALGVDALLVTRMTNVRYLTGFSGTTAFLILAEEPAIVVDFRYAEQAGREVDVAIHRVQSSREVWPATLALLSQLAPTRLGVEAATLTLAQHLDLGARTGLEPVPTNGLVERVRSIKDADEIEAIREAVLLSDAAYADVLGIVQAGMTEHRVAGEVERLQRAKGGERSASEIIAASGLRTSLPHGIATDRVLGANEPLMLDMGTVVRGYLADLTRTVHLGPAPPQFREIYAVVLEAQRRALDGIRPGMTGIEVDALSRDVITAAGYGERFGHSLGHGIGLDVHETPLFSPHDPTPAEAGMVMTVEPGIYVPGVGGVRIEDVVVVREDGCELLTTAPKELIEL